MFSHMSDAYELPKFKDHRENARAVYEFLCAICADTGLTDDALFEALISDVKGLLAGISEGTIKTGQPRIVEQLVRIAENCTEPKTSALIVNAIAACSERGLSAESHTFSGTFRGHSLSSE
jgi:hypothetical protein